MKDEVYYGKGMRIVREKYPELYEGINKLNGVIYTGRELDYKTQKLIAIGIVASKCDENATEKQMRSGMAELGITEGEIVDILRVVLLTAGMPAFNKGIRILEDILKK
ncbi:MAG TPA: carboxymuconolactone decarboxylase family protein [Candidatus Methanofastidiosa archaeon]|nr:carboxymuconolactone decarboxylase family protein [Candidatus Methanofastidiosa archaeon]HPR40963.1 carboxymuconolactone decarboxylase family protein [Candidatus Methanofastidiosa archaeon]